LEKDKKLKEKAGLGDQSEGDLIQPLALKIGMNGSYPATFTRNQSKGTLFGCLHRRLV